MEKHPLVSVIVVCYNAAEFIIDTLESVKAQTYKNIEVIVSDDGSKDGTVDIAKAWIEENKQAFVRTEIITVDHNTGVSANYNRAVRACEGEWIKNVDGDDLITPNCIQDNISFLESTPEAKIVFSNAIIFREVKGEKENLGFCITEKKKSFFTLNSKDQYKTLLYDNILPSQTCFVKSSLLKSHPYNEHYKALEDAPMWVQLTKDGNRFFYCDSVTALYRKNESTTNSSQKFYSPFYVESIMNYFWNEKIHYIKEEELNDAYNNNRRFLLLIEFAESILKNKKNSFSNLLFKAGRYIIYNFISFKL